jgi:spore coat polysaccharide biosynthesis predicted glycosyltransferase SpsG/RimJ/RimL family protein N-acetyltransferase
VTLVADAPGYWHERYVRLGAEVRAGHSRWLEEGAAWVVIDGYRLTALQEAVKGAGHRLLLVDDHASAGRYLADVILDQNLDVEASSYADPAPGAGLLLGPRYALLRREFREADRTRPRAGEAGTLLVALGGSPPAGARALVDTALADPPLSALSVSHLEETPAVAAAMVAADLAFAAAGVTAWELCCMGVPAVLTSVADNQLPVARALAARGIAHDLGPLAAATAGDLVAALVELARDRERRAEMAASGLALVDGQGARRVVSRLRAALLGLRPAGPGDCRLLWEWANDRAVRDWAFNPEPISWEEHASWFTTRLEDPKSTIYMAGAPDGTLVGQARFERDGADAGIGMSVAAAARGSGWGGALVDAAVRRYMHDTDVERIVARVLLGNGRSVAAFEAADFEGEGERSDGAKTWLQYARHRRART